MNLPRTIAEHHAYAITLLTAPRIDDTTATLLDSLPSIAHLLWSEGDGGGDASAINLRVFQEAVALLDTVADLGATAVFALLQACGARWRNVPHTVLRAIAKRQAAAPDSGRDDTLRTLEVEQVCAWANEARLSRSLAAGEWPELLRHALDWRPNDEIELRREPKTWSFPMPLQLRMPGWEIRPITSSLELVQSAQHHGVLCSIARAKSCLRGLEAWAYAVPVLRSIDNPEWCLVGLHRESESEAWSAKETYAPPASKQTTDAIAMSLATRANVKRMLQVLRPLRSAIGRQEVT